MDKNRTLPVAGFVILVLATSWILWPRGNDGLPHGRGVAASRAEPPSVASSERSVTTRRAITPPGFLETPVQPASETRVLAGRVFTESGNPLANGRIVAIPPRFLASRQEAKVSGETGFAGDFRLTLPANDWADDFAFVAVYDQHGAMLESGFAPISENLLISVTSRADDSWYIDGHLKMPLVPEEIEGWAAVYSTYGGTQPLAESRFRGNDSDVRLIFNLIDGASHDGAVELRVFAPGLKLCATEKFDSLSSFKHAFADGIDVDVKTYSISVPRLPSGVAVEQLQVVSAREKYSSTGWEPVVNHRLQSILGVGPHKVQGRAAPASATGYGTLRMLGADVAVVQWLTEVPGPHSLSLRIADDLGEALPRARVGIGLLTDDAGRGGALASYGVTGPDGRLTFNELPAGEYVARVRFPGTFGHTPKSFRLSIPSAEVSITMERPASVRVGLNVPTEVVGLISRFQTYWRFASDPEGAWVRREVNARLGHTEVRGLSPGLYDVFVYSEPFLGRERVQIERSRDAQWVIVTCQLPIEVTGRVVTDDGDSVKNTWVSVSGTSSAGQPSGFEWTRTRTDENGAFWLSLQGMSDNRLSVWNNDCTAVLRRVKFESGGTITIPRPK